MLSLSVGFLLVLQAMASATILGQVGVGKTACNFALSGFSQGSQLAGNSTFASPARLANYSAVSIPRSHGGLGFLRKKLEVSVRCDAISTKARVSEATEKKEIKPVVVIDNYDSFTYNLCQYLGDLGCKIEVYRNDEITVEELRTKNLRGILISPGPGNPQDSGISLEIVRKLGPTIPLFGVCMGLQCMGEAFGGKIVRAPNGVMHGKTSQVFYEENGEPGLLDGLPKYVFSTLKPCLFVELMKATSM